ncbi:MAG: pyruvate phosphate dikinase PEP/pyruvate-binding protein [Spirulinaceae cyanobacterium SM2_1_0]|nr:pyruvate phosphate dikinase PEP/pyruvate-binding protein [Spirulinaceae cyanobacterium SM2_1_0]
MPLSPVWGALIIFVLCPLLGGLPLIGWLMRALAGKDLQQVGTGNISVSAAFYHGGRLVGILAVCSEAAKGIAAVLLARAFFPGEPAWELVALIALVMGRYWMGKGAGTTNAFWGIVTHDPGGAALIAFIGGLSFTLFRDRHSGRLVGLFLLALILSLRHPSDPPAMLAAIALALTIGWIYQKIPDDLDLPTTGASQDSQTMFRFFRGDNALLTLNDRLEASKVGNKAATLAQLKRWGYPVPDGWVLPAGDDPRPLALSLQPTPDAPLIVRSSAVGEDGLAASAAGLYESIANITDTAALEAAILCCQTSYTRPQAIAYRRDRQLPDTSLAVLVQSQIRGTVSGVAFSRDPLERYSEAIVVEALSGGAERVVSGQFTPQRYRVYCNETADSEGAIAPDAIVEGEGDLPVGPIQAAAQLARDLERRFYGIPQDIEWSFDGEKLWLLQARPITNLQPIWTRKIAAEVLPGAIRPLTWSINRPLTCGVWGDIFTLVLAQRAHDLDFNDTAALHYAHAYFNASLLNEIFQRMGLPPESLEFLTRGAPFSKPSWASTLRNTPGLLRLLQREWQLASDFRRDDTTLFERSLHQIEAQKLEELSPEELFWQLDSILSILRRVTYYNILAPLSFAFRQALLGVAPKELDNSPLPEVQSLRELAQLAAEARHVLPIAQLGVDSCPSLFACLAELPDGEAVLAQFEEWLQRYSYLSEAATDIAIPRWREDPRSTRELFAQYLLHPPPESDPPPKSQGWRARQAQQRLVLKGQVAELYSRLLAHLRWTLLALAGRWQQAGILADVADIFFLEFSEVRQLLEAEETSALRQRLPALLEQRRSQFERDRQLTGVPYTIYGQPDSSAYIPPAPFPTSQQLRGIAASPGAITGRVRVVKSFRDLDSLASINAETILVVPYTDSGWAPLLARAGGLVAEVGGQLSHGAIVAREYRIPAVMDIPNATERLRDGQLVRLDGQAGLLEVLAAPPEAS